MTTVNDTTAQLAQFAATLKFTDIPAPVLRRAEDLPLTAPAVPRCFE